ncbi:hypothetical protein N7G274_010587 [Stereocaulon virgatum]|uniref:Uncharacterized protein n=1 Tax=Stereocaulon virgatum TaxID=373712 RepID=A0ABR3ZUE3_9LECA
MVWLIPSVLSRCMPSRPTLGFCRETVVRKLDGLRVACDSKRNNIYKHHMLVLSLSGIKIEKFSPRDLSTPGFTPPKISSAPTTPTSSNTTNVSRPHNNGGNNENPSSRSESTPPRPAYSQVKDDPYGIEEACMERKLSQPDDEGTAEITLGTNPNVPEGKSLLENEKAAVQEALKKVADLQALNAQYLKSLMTTRGIAHDAEDQVQKLRVNLSMAKISTQTLESWLEERDAELEGLEKDKVCLGMQLEQSEAECNDLRKLARDIWIRMSDLEIILAKKYGEMLDEEDDVQRYGDLRLRAMNRIDIPHVYMDIQPDLMSNTEDGGKISGQDRIIDEVSDHEETIIERYPLVDDRNAVVVWTEPPFPPNKLFDKRPGDKALTALNSEQKLEADTQALPVCNSSLPSSGRVPERSGGRSSASFGKQEEQVTVTEREKGSGMDLGSNDGAASPKEAALLVGGKDTVEHLSSVDDTSANTDRGFQQGTKSEKPKMSKAQRREAAMKRDAEVVAKKKAEEVARMANEKKRKQSKKGLRK